MLKVIKIPKIGGLYPSVDRETVARVLDVYETDDGIILVYYRTYEGEAELNLDKFWRHFKNE